jgi:3-oxoacyl-[acyl-carrier protein] reductase
MNFLTGKNALITGGTSGIGKAIAILFAQHGANVAIFGTDPEKGKTALLEIQEARADQSQKVLLKIGDISSSCFVEESVKNLLSEFEERIDLLVNNAGITKDQFLLKMAEEDWDRVINVNLKSAFLMSKAIIRPMMKTKNGKIINISSIIGLTGNIGQTNYAASKAGMIGFTKALAKEVGKKGICVNCIAPGFIETPMTEKLTEEMKNSYIEQIPLKRLGKPIDVAMCALFLASHMADYITGQVLTVDGGMVM